MYEYKINYFLKSRSDDFQVKVFKQTTEILFFAFLFRRQLYYCLD